MAAAYLKVIVDGNRVIRTFGGNRSEVREQANWYRKATYEQILKQHPKLTREQYKTLTVETYNK